MIHNLTMNNEQQIGIKIVRNQEGKQVNSYFVDEANNITYFIASLGEYVFKYKHIDLSDDIRIWHRYIVGSKMFEWWSWK